jgi:streptomycin 6-kinase
VTASADAIAVHLQRWDLVPDGDMIVTHSSRLLPVRRHGVPAMLKVPREPEEQRGSRVMSWWRGIGAARVLAEDDDGALLLERAQGARALSKLARSGFDDEATRTLCAVIATLHGHDAANPPPDLVPLGSWFKELWPAAERHGGILARSAAAARELLAAPQDVAVLHGDIHHNNVLDFGTRGWLAIDPKGLIGERGFDYANIFCNPEDDPDVAEPSRFLRRLDIVIEASGLDRSRLLNWILAWVGLSAAWRLGDDITAHSGPRIAKLASRELERS